MLNLVEMSKQFLIVDLKNHSTRFTTTCSPFVILNKHFVRCLRVNMNANMKTLNYALNFYAVMNIS